MQAETDGTPANILAERNPAPNLGDLTAIAAGVLSGKLATPDAVFMEATPC